MNGILDDSHGMRIIGVVDGATFGTRWRFGGRGAGRETIAAKGVGAGEGGGDGEDIEADGAAEVGVGFLEEDGGWVAHGFDICKFVWQCCCDDNVAVS